MHFVITIITFKHHEEPTLLHPAICHTICHMSYAIPCHDNIDNCDVFNYISNLGTDNGVLYFTDCVLLLLLLIILPFTLVRFESKFMINNSRHLEINRYTNPIGIYNCPLLPFPFGPTCARNQAHGMTVDASVNLASASLTLRTLFSPSRSQTAQNSSTAFFHSVPNLSN